MSALEEAGKHTERTILDALRQRHAPKNGGNGPEWAFVEHVRNSAGFNATRTIDAIALGLWPSRGMEMHGFEVKISRADFRREISDPAKMDAFAHVLDRFWIVAPTGVVPAAELPATWGLLEVGDKGTVRQKVAATLLSTERAPIPRSFLVPLLRAAGTAVEANPKAIREAEERGFQRGLKSAKNSGKQWERMYDRARDDLRRANDEIAAINKALGTSITGHAYNHEARNEKLRTVADAVRLALTGDDHAARARNTIKDSLSALASAKERIERTEAWITKETGVSA